MPSAVRYRVSDREKDALLSEQAALIDDRAPSSRASGVY